MSDRTNRFETVKLRWARAATKHRISRERSRHVIDDCGLRFEQDPDRSAAALDVALGSGIASDIHQSNVFDPRRAPKGNRRWCRDHLESWTLRTDDPLGLGSPLVQTPNRPRNLDVAMQSLAPGLRAAPLKLTYILAGAHLPRRTTGLAGAQRVIAMTVRGLLICWLNWLPRTRATPLGRSWSWTSSSCVRIRDCGRCSRCSRISVSTVATAVSTTWSKISARG